MKKRFAGIGGSSASDGLSLGMVASTYRLEFVAGVEGHHTARRDGDFLASFWVAAGGTATFRAG